MIGPISFAAPAVLAGLAVLPALYFLLRATPPAPRRQPFPPLRLLRDLVPTERSPMRMPLWLLVLRLLAAALLIIGFAGPQIVPPPILGGSGPVLIAIDNGWASAADFAARQAAARRLVDQAGSRGVILLATAPDTSGQAPQASGVLARTKALAAVGALHAQPWPPDRKTDAEAVREVRKQHPDLTAVYVADGLAARGLGAFLAALDPARVVASPASRVRLLDPPAVAKNGTLIARVAVVPQPIRVSQPVLAENAAGAALARVTVRVQPNRAEGEAKFDLPVALASKIRRLALPDVASPGAIALLDGGARHLVVGLAAGGTANPEQHLLGSLYYIRHALPSGTTVRTDPLDRLIDEAPGALILADLPLRAPDIARLRRYTKAGGVVIRFAGPLTAAKPDSLNPDPLLQGVRDLGGALAGGRPETVSEFAPQSPLAGLAPPRDAHIARQSLADPATLDPSTVWARLADGTPIVLGARQGRGALVDVLTAANPGWSDWPLAGDFPALIDRFVHLGVGRAPEAGTLKPVRVLDGAGRMVVPGSAVRPLQAAKLATTRVSPAHPPGLWGDEHGSAALNVGGHVPALAPAAYPPLTPVTGLDALPRARHFGPPVLAAALALLLADMLISLALRGTIRLGAAFVVLVLFTGFPHARAATPPAALTTTLAYIRTGDAAVDSISRAGLAALSRRVNQETAATLAPPRGVVPGDDNLNLYPMIYWQITSSSPPPDRAACGALDAFMAGGGLLVIDTDGGDPGAPGSGAGFDPGVGAALHRATACLSIPPLKPLSDHDTLAHTFYLARRFPGRFEGAPVYIAAPGGRDADGVSPVVIGSNDWAGAWAVDSAGDPMQALLPGSPGQRQAADRFGVNLVMYALTGTYKSDQLQIPTFLRRLSE